MSNIQKGNGVTLVTCPICKKVFVPAPQHAFKIDGKFVCSWSCLRHGAMEKEKKRRERRKGHENS